MRHNWISVLFHLSAVPLSGLATPLSPRWEDMVLKHSWNVTPENWECLGLPPTGTIIDLHVALKPHREEALIDSLYEVSNPSHAKYGKYLTKEQVAELVAPHPDTLDLVHSWLEYHRVPSTSVTHGGSYLTLTGVSVSQANNLLGTSYKLYAHTKTNETIVRAIGYSLPAVLHAYVQTVAPTTYFSSPLTQWQTPRKRSSVPAARQTSGEPMTVSSTSRDNDGACTPALLRWLYSTYAYEPTAMGRNMLGVTGYNGEYPSPYDLTRFMHKYRSDGINATYGVMSVNNGEYYPTRPGFEANVDIQITESMTYPTPLIFYSTAKAPNGDAYIPWLITMLNLDFVPPTITTSYGNYEHLYPIDHVTYICFLLAQLSARGVSLLFATGDHGVGNGNCRSNDGTVRFTPLFPATCPYVTAVGGTTNYMPEVAASLSGGGFSNYFLRPPYQQLAVPTFLQTLGHLYSGLYNSSGRGIPDIAAQAIKIPLFLNGEEYPTHGTSCATPIVASIISLLNDYLLSQGKPALGFLNPWLYSRGLVGLNDIIYGWNPGCATHGFPAVPGWDPVTGLGTPDFEHLQYILDLG